MITLFGIPNCDTVKRARAWLTDEGVAYRFHDFKKDGVPEPLLDQWVAELGWDALVNRRGTTWRRLDDAARAAVVDAASAKAALLANPSLVKRPVVAWEGKDDGITVGFDAGQWQRKIGNQGLQGTQT
ncbi:MAG: ArsC-like protein [Variovorax sp.]|nr:ArsC-like protein [Variovorax sp.]